MDAAVYEAARALHDEAHAAEKTAFRHCRRRTCLDLLAAMEEHACWLEG